MKTSISTFWSLRLITLGVWSVAMLCGIYWAMKFIAVKPVNAGLAAVMPAIVPDTQAIGRLLGAPAFSADRNLAAPVSGNYVLFGLATTKTGGGVALIAVDGKPAKPYQVGSPVTEAWVLKSVSRTDAVLATSASAPDGLKLGLPLRQPATGIISSVTPSAGRSLLPVPLQQAQARPQTSSATGFISPSAIAATTPAAGSAPLTPAQIDAVAQRPLSHYTPPPSESSGRANLLQSQSRVPAPGHE